MSRPDIVALIGPRSGYDPAMTDNEAPVSSAAALPGAPLPSAPAPEPLAAAEKRALRAAAHSLKVVVTVGGKGVTRALVDELNIALDVHELLKVRVNAGDREEREQLVALLCESTGAQVVQRTGFVATLWRRRREAPEKPKPGVERGRKREARKRKAIAGK